MKGYWTRHYFDNNETAAFESLFGVHFAGSIKPWDAPPYHTFGQPMDELDDIVKQFRLAI